MADPGFPVGQGVHLLEGCGPPTWALFGENVCKNERIGSHGGVHSAPPRSANEIFELSAILGDLGCDIKIANFLI